MATAADRARFHLRYVLVAFVFALSAATLHAASSGAGEEPPLPLAANWNCSRGYSPEWQFEQMKKGHHLLFTIRLSAKQPDGAWKARYQPIFEMLREKKAPMCFRWNNWLDIISDRTPLGPVEPWRKAGEGMLAKCRAQLKLMHEWHPDPPYVVMLSNNEGRAPSFKRVTQSARFKDKSDDEKQKIVGEGYAKRYKAMFDGMRAGVR